MTATLTPYEQHRDYVLRVLGHRCAWLDPADRESILHDAYAVFLEKQRDGHLDADSMLAPQVRAYLTQTALNKAMDEGKRAGRRRSVSLDDEATWLEPPDPGRDLAERIAAQFDDARVREIVAELPERQQLVIKLRFFFNRTPQEIQRYLGVTERVYRRELERATRHISERFELVRDGSFCESRRSLILAYVTGVAGPNRMSEARRHLESCPGCAQMVTEMRAATRRVAAIAPLPALAISAGHGLIPGRGGALRGVLHRAARLLDTGREHALRRLVAADPSRAAAFSNVRPGAAAMLVAGCLGAGTTATYCVVHGLPAPVRSLIGLTSPSSRRQVTAPAPRVTPGTAARAATVEAPELPSLGRSRPPSVRASRTGSSSRAPRLSRRSSSASASASPSQVHRQTAPQFGVGNGNPVEPRAPASALAPSLAARRSPPPPPAKPLPEFDP